MTSSAGSTSRSVLLSGFVLSVWLRQKLLQSGAKSLDTWGPRWLAVALARAMNLVARCAGVKFETDTYAKWYEDPLKRLDPERQYLTPWHPHGALTFCAAFFTNTMTSQSTTPAAPGPRGWFVGIADLLFRFPLLGEGLVLWNCRPVSETVSQRILGSGRSYAIQPGGIPEQVLTDHRRELIVFPPTLGFCRLAIQHGTPLVPIYAFGENQVFSTYKWGRKTTRRLHQALGIAMPMINPWPNSVTLHMKWGRPVEVGAREESPPDERVREVFARYVAEVARLFEEHRHACLPADVAARGLTVLWRGHGKEELDGLLDAAGLERDQVPGLVTVSGLCSPPPPPPPHSRL